MGGATLAATYCRLSMRIWMVSDTMSDWASICERLDKQLLLSHSPWALRPEPRFTTKAGDLKGPEVLIRQLEAADFDVTGACSIVLAPPRRFSGSW